MSGTELTNINGNSTIYVSSAKKVAQKPASKQGKKGSGSLQALKKVDNILKEKLGDAETIVSIKPAFTCQKCRCHVCFEVQGAKVCANCYGV